MAVINTNLVCDLQKAVKVEYIDGVLFSQDNQANKINVTVLDGGQPATLSGTVSANIIRSDGGTVAASGGSITGNVASITLPAAAYSVPGVVSIVVKLTASGVITTIAAIVANMYRASTDTAIDPGTVIPSIQTLISQINAAVASIPADYSSLWTKLAPAFSTDASYVAGQYVTNNSGLYRFNTTHTGDWSSSDVTAVNLGGEITNLKSAIDAKSKALYDSIHFDAAILTNSGYIANDGTIGANANYGYSDLFSIPVGLKSITINRYENMTGAAIAYYSDKAFIAANFIDGVPTPSGSKLYITPVTLAVPNGAKYYALSGKTTAGADYAFDAQLNIDINKIALDVNTMGASIVALSDEVEPLKDNTSEDKRIPSGTMAIVKGNDGNASYDSATNTYTIPANTNCGGISLGYRYTAQEDDLQKTIRFIVYFDATIYHQSQYIMPLVYWNYVNVTTESYVSTTMYDDRCVFDITIPNERKNLDVRLNYTNYNNVGYAQKLQVTGIDYYYMPIGKTYYTFNSNFVGKKLSPFGDSYTAQGKWQPFIKARLGLASYSGWSQSGGTLTSVYEEIQNIDTTADIVTVWIGTNDYAGNRRVGSLMDDVTDPSIKDPWGYTTFCAALNYVCNWLSNNMKGKCIVFITPTQRMDSTDTTFIANNGTNEKGEPKNNAGFALEDYADAMKMVANHWGYPVCDMYHESGINKNSYTAFYQADALHPSDAGAELLAQKIAIFINGQI